MILSAGETSQKSGGKKIAGTGHIRHLRNRFGWNRFKPLARNNDAAFFTARHNREFGIATQRLDRGIEVGSLIEAVELALVSEHDVNEIFADQVKKLGAIAIDAECVRQRERNAAPGLVGDTRSLDESLFGLRRIPKIAFEISNCSARHLSFVDIGRPQVLRRP